VPVVCPAVVFALKLATASEFESGSNVLLPLVRYAVDISERLLGRHSMLHVILLVSNRYSPLL
jgi:hypothetical protein